MNAGTQQPLKRLFRLFWFADPGGLASLRAQEEYRRRTLTYFNVRRHGEQLKSPVDPHRDDEFSAPEFCAKSL
jgi:hypothetical protein